MVYKQSSASSTALERWSAGPLGQIPHSLGSLSEWEPPVLPALQGVPGSTPWIVTASAWRSAVQWGLGDVRLVEDGPRLDSTLSPRSCPSPLSSALAVSWSGPGGSEVRTQTCFPSWLSPQGAGIPPTTKRGAPRQGGGVIRSWGPDLRVLRWHSPPDSETLLTFLRKPRG